MFWLSATLRKQLFVLISSVAETRNWAASLFWGILISILIFEINDTIQPISSAPKIKGKSSKASMEVSFHEVATYCFPNQ